MSDSYQEYKRRLLTANTKWLYDIMLNHDVISIDTHYDNALQEWVLDITYKEPTFQLTTLEATIYFPA